MNIRSWISIAGCYSNRHVCHVWEEVRARLNEEFGRRRSVAVCYRQVRASDKRADALVAERTADPVAAAEAPVAHVDAHEPSQSASASSIFSLPTHPDAHTAFGGDGGLDTDSDDDDGDLAEEVRLVDAFDENSDGGELLSDGLPTQVHAAHLPKQQWAPLGPFKPLLHPQVK